ncbi:MAG: hypothetical protein HY903_05275 [Deltaproteobacteria bacterium]|nr:hypothetical protein [Deltaproteobacteria bacterium]
MSVDAVSRILQDARKVDSQYSKEKISARELQKAWNAALAPEPGEPAGKPLSAEEAKLFQDLAAATDLAPSAKTLLKKILGQIPGLLQGGATGDVIALPERRGYKVFLKPEAGFVMESTHAAPGDPLAAVHTFYHAGGWLQASFGTGDNLFTKAMLDPAGKRAALKQMTDATSGDLGSLSAVQREQLLGSVAALTLELVKSFDAAAMAPSGSAEAKAVQAEAFAAFCWVLDDPRMGVLAKRSLLGYIDQSSTTTAKLAAAQKAELDLRRAKLFPKAPADYAKWEQSQKSVIKIDHVCGEGENFLFGFVKELVAEGVGDAKGDTGKYKFELTSGDTVRGPAKLRVVIPATDRDLNKWGRDMTIEIDVREYRTDMYKKMSDPQVDIVSYGGHSDFGGNTLDSLENAPAQAGDKIIMRDLCCGVDTKNVEARKYPEASLNAITSTCSSYFRTTTDPQQGKYANESEGYLALMTLTRGLLGKKGWDEIGADLARHANWWGHDSANNWTWPTDPRGGAFVDNDGDGIPNVFDLLPSYNTTDVAASTAKEFELKVPTVDADSIAGTRAFQALQFVNTATNYNTVLQSLNAQRRLVSDPNGMWFNGKDDPDTYVRCREGKNGSVYVQLNSALADMTVETLRVVLYIETVRYYAKKDAHLFADKATQNAMALLFAASSLSYDQSSRDTQIFDGLKKIYGFGASPTWSELQSAVSACEDRHNYTGDETEVTKLVTKFRAQLAAAGAGDPAVKVT